MLPCGVGAVAVPCGDAAPGGGPARDDSVGVSRDGGRRRHAGAWQAVPGVPDHGLLRVAAEARGGGATLAAGAGVCGWVQSLPQDRCLDSPRLPPARPHAHTVWVLQAPDVMHLQQRRHGHGDRGGAGRGLLPVEQRSGRPVLRVRVVQGGSAGAGAPRLAQHHHPQRHPGPRPHRHLRLWLLRLPQRPPRRLRPPALWPKPHLKDPSTLGLLLVKVVPWPKRAALLV